MEDNDFITHVAEPGRFVAAIQFPPSVRPEEGLEGRLAVSLTERQSRMLYHQLAANMADSKSDRRRHGERLIEMCFNSDTGVWDGSVSASVL